MDVQDIYRIYRVPKNLQKHMLRVASVGWYISEQWNSPINQRGIVAALLLHDLGNLLKFDLEKGVSLIDEDERDVAYWMNVKQELTIKYSDDEHIATQMMANEMGVSERVLFLLSHMGSSNLSKVLNTDDWELKIVTYSDFRVDPHGFVTVHDRFADLIKRYQGRNHVLADKDQTLKKRDFCFELENQIQSELVVDLSELPTQMLEAKIFELATLHFSELLI